MNSKVHKLLVFIFLSFVSSSCMRLSPTPSQQCRYEHALLEYDNLKTRSIRMRQNINDAQKQVDCAKDFLFDLVNHTDDEIYRGMTRVQRKEFLDSWSFSPDSWWNLYLERVNENIVEVEKTCLNNDFEKELRGLGKQRIELESKLVNFESLLQLTRFLLKENERILNSSLQTDLRLFWGDRILKVKGELNPSPYTLGCLSMN